MNRKKFIKYTGLIGTTILTKNAFGSKGFSNINQIKTNKPIIISTWKHGLTAGIKAMQSIHEGDSSLSAVEKGIREIEQDTKITSVGIGGFPDANGDVTLDASIMDWNGNAGAVAYLKSILHPISVARLVMEKTKHVLLAGEGALNFAKENGFIEQNLLTEQAQNKWIEWKKNHKKDLISPHLNHDTVGLLAIDNKGNISGGVSTSGWAFKLPGRIGDSPIIGAGLFVDNEVGAACSTGLGEEAIKSAGSFLVVEKMREGYSPYDACKYVVERIIKKSSNKDKFQIAFVALNKNGEVGAYSLRPKFQYAVVNLSESQLISSSSHFAK